MFSRAGILREILTDQGTPFMSKVTKELYTLLKIKHLKTSVYHPQTDGLLERFNKTLKATFDHKKKKTLKAMLRKVVETEKTGIVCCPI